MTKLEKISFYSQLADLYDLYKPEELPAKIYEVVAFIKNHGDGQNDLDEMMESLLVIKRGFEEALIEKKSWSMVLQNPSRGYKIAIDPITRCLSNPDSYAPITTPDIDSHIKNYLPVYRDWETDRKSTRLNSSHSAKSRMPSSA